MLTFLRAERTRIQAWGGFRKALYAITVALIAAYIFTLFSFSGRDGWNYVNLGVGAAMVLSIIAYELLYGEIRLDEYALIAVAFCLLTILSTLMVGRIFSLPKSLYFQVAFGIAIYQFAKERENFKWTIVSIAIGGLAFAIYFIVHYRAEFLALRFFGQNGRLGGFFDNENNVGRDFVILTLVALYLIIWKKQWYMILYALVMAVLLVSTGSISNIVSLAVVIILTAFFAVKGRKKLIVLGITAGVAVAFVALLQLPAMSYFNKRIYGMFAAFFGLSGGDNSFIERFELSRDAILFFLKSPMFGNGYGYVSYQSIDGLFAHNNFTEIMAAFGIIGLLVYELLMILPLVRLRKERSSLSRLVLALVLYLFIFQMFLVTFYQKIDHIVFGLAFAFVSKGYYGGLYLSFKGKRVSFGFRVNKGSEGLKRLGEKVKPCPLPLETDKFKID